MLCESGSVGAGEGGEDCTTEILVCFYGVVSSSGVEVVLCEVFGVFPRRRAYVE